MGNDIASRLPLEIGIHKNQLPFTEQGRHRVILYFHGQRARPRHFRRLDHHFGMDDVRKVLASRHLSHLLPGQQWNLPHVTRNGPARTTHALPIG